MADLRFQSEGFDYLSNIQDGKIKLEKIEQGSYTTIFESIFSSLNIELKQDQNDFILTFSVKDNYLPDADLHYKINKEEVMQLKEQLEEVKTHSINQQWSYLLQCQYHD